MLVGGILFSLIGHNGFAAVREIFITPLIDTHKWQDLGIKAAPLILIAVGLSIGFRANVWNIGAEGQYIVGGLAGTGIALLTWELEGWWILPLMCIAGVIGGWALCVHPSVFENQAQRQRNLIEFDADVCGHSAFILSDARPMERP